MHLILKTNQTKTPLFIECVCVCRYVWHHVQVESEDSYVDSVFSFNLYWVWEINLGGQVYVTSAFTCWTSQQSKKENFNFNVNYQKIFLLSHILLPKIIWAFISL